MSGRGGRLRRVLLCLLPGLALGAGHAHAGADVLRDTLPNGLRVVIVRDALAPMVATRLVYFAGSTEASADFPGTAHALEHMMFRGTPTLDASQLNRVTQATGGTVNAVTDYDYTHYLFNVMSADLPVILRIEADRMRNLALTPAQWARERGAIAQEVSADRSRTELRADEAFRAAIYAGTPYAWTPLGTRQSFDATDIDRLKRFYQSWYAPNNALLLIVGDVDPHRTRDLVRADFAAIPRRDLPSRPVVPPAPPAAGEQTVHTDGAMGEVVIGWRMPGLEDRDAAALMIMADAISNQRGALGRLGFEGKALGSSFSYTANHGAGFAEAAIAFPHDGDPRPFLVALRTVLAGYREHGIPSDLVEAAKRARIRSAAFAGNSITGLAQTWLETLADWRMPDPDRLISRYAAVTPARVNALVRRFLAPDHAVIQFRLPSGHAAAVADKGFGGVESFGDSAGAEVELPLWARSVLTMPPTPHHAPPAADWVLANGLRLIVRPMHQTHSILMLGTVHENADLEQPAGQEGVSALTTALCRFGTAVRDRIAIAKAADDIGGQINCGTTFGVAARTQDFGAALALLGDIELHPAFRDADVALVRDNLAKAQQGALRMPVHAFYRAAMQATVPKGDPSLREATPQTIARLTRDDVVAYFRRAYRPDMTAIEVIGDITPQAARAAVWKAFGGWTARGPKPETIDPPVPVPKVASIQMDGDGRTQDQVSLTELVSLRQATPDRIAFSVGNAVLSRGFSSRLYQALRERTGYVYDVTADVEAQERRGAFMISFGADPAKVGLVKAEIRAVLDDLRTRPVSDAELGRVKAGMLRTAAMENQSLESIAGRDVWFAVHDLPPDQANRNLAVIAATTAEQVRDLFAREIHPDQLSTFIYGPAPPGAASSALAGAK